MLMSLQERREMEYSDVNYYYEMPWSWIEVVYEIMNNNDNMNLFLNNAYLIV